LIGILIKSCYVLTLLLWIEVGRLFWIRVHDIWRCASFGAWGLRSRELTIKTLRPRSSSSVLHSDTFSISAASHAMHTFSVWQAPECEPQSVLDYFIQCITVLGFTG
jgi:hypothetical protein